MEGLTLDSLFKQVCDKLDTHQFALAGKSTTHALVFFLQVILEALDQGDSYARIFFTDFSKGFLFSRSEYPYPRNGAAGRA